MRNYETYEEACKYLVSQGYQFLRDSGTGSYAPTIWYKHPVTGDVRHVMWNQGRGYIAGPCVTSN